MMRVARHAQVMHRATPEHGMVAMSGQRYKGEEVKKRISSVRTVAKITSSMKMIASSKLGKAQQRVSQSQPFIDGAAKLMNTEFALPDYSDFLPEEIPVDPRKHLAVVLTSDKGLCGAANSSVVKAAIPEIDRTEDSAVIVIGEKAKGMMRRNHSDKILWSVSDVGGTKTVSYLEVATIAEKIRQAALDGKFERVTIWYNKYVNTVTAEPAHYDIPAPTPFSATNKHVKTEFENDREATLDDFWSYNLANTLFASFVSSNAAELAARMTSMDNASKNADEMAAKLELQFNRQRQAAITTEITEIVSGAAAIQEANADE